MKLIAGVLTVLVLIVFVETVNAIPTELVSNGGFESGFSSWTEINGFSGGFVINDGTFDPPGPLGITAPFSGVSALVFQFDPGSHTLWQGIDLTGGYVSASLSWVDKIDNWAESFSDPNQEWRVELWDTSNSLITELFSTDPGDSLHQDWTTRTANLTPYIGGLFRLAFTVEDDLSFFNIQLDDVSLLAEPIPEPSSLLLMGVGILGLAGYSRKRFKNN